MTSLELVTDLYKPYRITKKMKCTIIESMDGTFVVKAKSNKDLNSIFNYLDSRDFYNHPKLVDSSRTDIDIFEYIEDSEYMSNQKIIDLIKVVASLHSKTTYTKEITEDKFKEIYETINDNLIYYEKKYDNLVSNIEEEVFMSPSHYLFIRNYSKLKNNLAFCKKELDKWYDLVNGKREMRICTIHNNLSLSHFCKKDKEVLISWNNVTQDTPLLDIYKLYLNEGMNVNFNTVLSTYLKIYPLESDELKLLLILIAMPVEINIDGDEFNSCKELSRIFDSIYRSEQLIRPYYLVDDEIQKQ